MNKIQNLSFVKICKIKTILSLKNIFFKTIFKIENNLKTKKEIVNSIKYKNKNKTQTFSMDSCSNLCYNKNDKQIQNNNTILKNLDFNNKNSSSTTLIIENNNFINKSFSENNLTKIYNNNQPNINYNANKFIPNNNINNKKIYNDCETGLIKKVKKTTAEDELRYEAQNFANSTTAHGIPLVNQ